MYQYVKLKSFLSKNIVRGFCLFIALISFKPSEPYLSQYLVCNLSNLREACSTEVAQLCQIRSGTCRWNAVGSKCEIIPCNDITSKCDERQNYCTLDRSSGSCADTTCYKDFTESEVNDSIYPWSTYAYLPILLILGVAAELIGYRSAILIGISGRIATRFLLLYGTSLSDMQFMQVTYSVGSAAEDIFKAYVYTMVTQDRYQEATSYIATSALLSSIFAGIIGDSLVAVNDVSLRVLMIISACFVCIGAVVGFFVILPAQKPQQLKLSLGEIKDMMTYAFMEEKGRSAYKTIRISMHQLGLVLRIPAMRSLIVWWIIGNASYAVIYNYEVSIFKELNGSNNWNGTAIAYVLLMGAAGAIAPIGLGGRLNALGSVKSTNQHDGPYTSVNHNYDGKINIEDDKKSTTLHDIGDADNSDGESKMGYHNTLESNIPLPESTDQSIEVLEHQKQIYSIGLEVYFFLSIAGAVSIGSLWVFIVSWSVIPSIAMLGFFFLSWQFISVITLTQLAQCLMTVTSIDQKSGMKSDVTDDVTECPLNSYRTVTRRSKETVSHSITGNHSYKNVNTHTDDDTNSAQHSMQNKILKRSSKEGALENGREIVQTTTDSNAENMVKRKDSRDNNHEGRIRMSSNNVSPKKNFGLSEDEDDDTAVSIRTEVEYDGIKSFKSANNNNVPKEDESTSWKVVDLNSEKMDERHEDEEGYKSSDISTVKSPFSLAIVTIVGLSVLLQGILQGVFFSYLALPLRAACSMLLFFYILSTVLFALGCLGQVLGPGYFERSYLTVTSMILREPNSA